LIAAKGDDAVLLTAEMRRRRNSRPFDDSPYVRPFAAGVTDDREPRAFGRISRPVGLPNCSACVRCTGVQDLKHYPAARCRKFSTWIDSFSRDASNGVDDANRDPLIVRFCGSRRPSTNVGLSGNWSVVRFAMRRFPPQHMFARK